METSKRKSFNGSAEQTTNNESNSNKLVEQFPVSGTPFTIVKVDEHWFLTIGKYRLTNQLGSREEAEAEVHDASWTRMMVIMKIMIKEHEEEKRLEDTIKMQKKMQEIKQEINEIPEEKRDINYVQTLMNKIEEKKKTTEHGQE